MTPIPPAVTDRHRRRSQCSHRFRVIAVVGVAAVITLAAASTAAAAHTKKVTKIRGGTAYWAEAPSSPPNYIFPFISSPYFTTANVEQFQQLMYRPLYWMGQASTPALNESLSLAAPPVYGPGNTVTVTLKPYRWSNGETLDARDVIFWMNMLHAEKVNWASYIPGAFPDNVRNVVADSPTQLAFTLTQGYNPEWFTDNQLSQITPLPLAWDVTSKAATPGSGQCSAASYGSLDLACDAVYTFLSAQATAVTGYASNPLWKVVDGPWRLASFTSSGTVTLQRNPTYSGPRTGLLTKFVELPFSSSGAEQAAITDGRLDVGYLPMGDVSKTTSDPNRPARHTALPTGFGLAPLYPWAIDYIPYNFNSIGDRFAAGRIFSQLYVRQALQMLVDQPGQIRKLFKGYGLPTVGPFPLQPPRPFASAIANRNPYPYDPTKAVGLLQANGWKVVPGGLSTCQNPGTGPGECGPGIPAGAALQFTLQYSSDTPWLGQLLAAEKASWATAGIEVSLTSARQNVVLADAVPCAGGQSCTWELADWGTGWTFTPDVYPTGEQIFGSGAATNVGSYSDFFNATSISETLTTATTLGSYFDYLATQLPVIYEPVPASSLTEIKDNLHGVEPQNVLGALTPEDWYLHAVSRRPPKIALSSALLRVGLVP